MLAQGEWYMTNRDIDWREYEKLASGFYPSRFNAAEWVAAIKASGAKYICFTSRHHEGFSMFDTEYSDFNIVDATPFKRDVIKELADECHKQGIKLHFYYSHLDWRRDDYPQGRTGRGTGRPEGHGDWPHYFEFMNNQLTELLTNYGPVGAIWFDGKWDQDGNPDFDWQLDEQYAMIHRLQPSCLIANNHHETPFPGENIQIFERDLPGENSAGLSGQAVSDHLPLETCETMNGMWGYKITDQNYKSTEELIRLLVRAAGKNANLLLNIGPQPNGELPEVAVQRLKEIGEWMQKYGETIYGTRIGEVAPHPWGVSTSKDNVQYIHILEYQDNTIFLPVKSKVKSALCLNTGEPLEFSRNANGIVVNLSKVPDEVDYIVRLTMAD
jgi:alpha-L-fucosidase